MSYTQNSPKHKNDKRRFTESRTGSERKEERNLTPEEKFGKMFEEFKFQTIRDGKLRELKDRRYYLKPGEKKRKKIAEAQQKAKQNQKRRKQGNR